MIISGMCIVPRFWPRHSSDHHMWIFCGQNNCRLLIFCLNSWMMMRLGDGRMGLRCLRTINSPDLLLTYRNHWLCMAYNPCNGPQTTASKYCGPDKRGLMLIHIIIAWSRAVITAQPKPQFICWDRPFTMTPKLQKIKKWKQSFIIKVIIQE